MVQEPYPGGHIDDLVVHARLVIEVYGAGDACLAGFPLD